MRTILLLYFCLIVYKFSQAQANMDIGTSPAGTEYLIYIPKNYDPGKSYPLLVYLHGAQAIGPTISCSFGKGLPGAINNASNTFFDTLQMFVVAPHVKLGEKCSDIANNDYEWDPAMVDEVVTSIIDNYNIDENRVFGSGISLGAKGIWDYALAYPDKLIGLAPFSGNAPIDNICSLSGVAVWAFHGEADGTIPPVGGDDRKGSQTIVEAINDCPTQPYLRPHLTLFEAKGHNGWDQVYDLSAGYNLYEWLLSLKKNVSTDYTPLVNLGPDIKIANPDHPIEIHSFAFDPNGSISLYNWDQLSGPGVSFQDGKESVLLDLDPSATPYVFMLKVTDNEGNQNSDTVQITVSSSASGPQVTELRLYDGKNNQDLGPIANNDIIDISSYDPELLDVKATVANLNSRASVRFELNSNRNFTTTNDNKITSGYFIGENGHKSFNPSEGEYTIRATAYGDRNALDQGYSYQVTFSFSADPLPIKLLDFNVSGTEEGIELHWTTTEEVNNSHFEIYQGIGDANNMKKIASVPRAEPNKTINHYSYKIKAAPFGQLYYQLKSIDHDGHTDYSKIVSFNRINRDADIKLYPNPATKGSFICESSGFSRGTVLQLVSSAGEVMRKYTLTGPAKNRIVIDTYGILPGVYFLRINQQNNVFTKTVLIRNE